MGFKCEFPSQYNLMMHLNVGTGWEPWCEVFEEKQADSVWGEKQNRFPEVQDLGFKRVGAGTVTKVQRLNLNVGALLVRCGRRNGKRPTAALLFYSSLHHFVTMSASLQAW